MDGLQEPVVRCFAESGPPDARRSPRAATELLGGILFSLIFANPDATSDSSGLRVRRVVLVRRRGGRP